MHADIHLQLHTLTSDELRRDAATARPRPAARVPALRARMGWKLVELGLRMATPAHGPAALAA
ncbi:hypothetical protein ACFU8I_36660 [Streptomyces sp. NPDC057540]|uniref:hypothetical protein n=1 Tax=Streptomyces sp. NPDC057540 TaxID=3346160 RepID=UPI0036D19F62